VAAVTGIRRLEKMGFAPFFLAATLTGMAGVPVWVATYLGIEGPWSGMTAPHWHGHEMIFGYALAVLGGYLLTKVTWRTLLALFAAWAAGRAAGLAGEALPPGISALAAVAYPAVLAFYAGAPFLRAAKQLRSAVPGLLLAAFLIAELIFQAGVLGLVPGGTWIGLGLGVDLIVLMLFLMGGRVTAAATSGAIQARGRYLPGIAQARLETAGLLALLAMTLVDLSGLAPQLAGLLALGASVVVATRLVRWQVWTVVDALDISSLHAGYGFIAVGLALKALAQITGALGVFEAMHGVSVGALGVLSLTIMGRVVTQRTTGLRALPGAVRLAIGLVILATLARLLALDGALRQDMLVAASIAWTMAMAIFAGNVLWSLRCWWAREKGVVLAQ